MAGFRRIANLFRRTRVDREIDAELEAHIALRMDDNVAHGMSRDEARRDALLRFGNPTATKERVVASDTSLGITGMINPQPITSIRRVMNIKPTAAFFPCILNR